MDIGTLLTVKSARKLVFFGLCLVATTTGLQAALPQVPGIQSHFTDERKKVPAAANERIDKALGAFQENFKIDVAVVILPNPVDSVADMAKSCYLTWSIGKTPWEGGLLIAVDPSKKDCAVFQGAEDVPLSPQAREMIENMVRAEVKNDNYERAISSVVSRLGRLLPARYKPVKVYPDLVNDPQKGSAYATGAGIVFLIALFSWKFRPWR